MEHKLTTIASAINVEPCAARDIIVNLAYKTVIDHGSVYSRPLTNSVMSFVSGKQFVTFKDLYRYLHPDGGEERRLEKHEIRDILQNNGWEYKQWWSGSDRGKRGFVNTGVITQDVKIDKISEAIDGEPDMVVGILVDAAYRVVIKNKEEEMISRARDEVMGVQHG